MSEVLAELVAKITADASELKKALAESEKGIQDLGKKTDKETRDISQAVRAMGQSFAITGAAITASMSMMIKSFVSTGSELHDLSLKTGISAKALAGLKYAAEQNGASLGTVEMALRRVAMAMSGADDDAEGTSKAFSKIGMTLKDLKGLNPEQQFLKIASAIAQIPDPMTRSATAVSFFGRSGTDMLPMLSEGAEGLRKMMEEGQRLTGWTDEGTKSADALGDALGSLKTSTMGVFNAIGLSLAPTIKDLVDSATMAISKITDWTKANPELARVISLVSIQVGILLTAFGGALLIIPKLIAGFQALQVVAMAANISLGPVGWAFAAIGAALFIVLPLLLDASNKLDAVALSSDKVTASMEVTGKTLTEALGESGAALNEYINRTNKGTDATQKMAAATDGLKDSVEYSKQAIASATWMADGYTYRMSLFTQAEIDAAKASGKKIDKLYSQNEITETNIDTTQKYKETIDDTAKSVEALNDSFKESANVGDTSQGVDIGAITAPIKTAIAKYQTASGGWGTSTKMNLYENAMRSIDAVWQELKARGVPDTGWGEILKQLRETIIYPENQFAAGGIINKPTLAMMGENAPRVKEAVIPETMWGEIGAGTISINIENFTADSPQAVDHLAEKVVQLIRARMGIR